MMILLYSLIPVSLLYLLQCHKFMARVQSETDLGLMLWWITYITVVIWRPHCAMTCQWVSVNTAFIVIAPWAQNRLHTELKLLQSTTTVNCRLKNISVPVCLWTPGNSDNCFVMCPLPPSMGRNINNSVAVTVLPSVLWRCCLGGRKGIRPVKNWVVGCWCGYLTGARCRLAYSPAGVTATYCRLLQ